MANPYGYNFYFKDGSDVLTFPITPAALSIKVGSKNKVVTLIDEGDINILKSPSLIEVEFEARFPMRKYPYSREVSGFENYFNKFKELKEDKKSFRFIVARTTPNGKRTWDTNLLMALEDFELREDADEGDDVLVSFKLKQYKEYGVKTLKNSSTNPETTSTSDIQRSTDGKGSKAITYTVQSGDCLWNIAKAAYGDGSKWQVIYEANKSVIESVAEQHRGKGKGSSNGQWIYPGTELIIPNISDANLTVQKLNSTNTKTYSVAITSIGDKNYRGEIAIEHVFNGQKVVTKNSNGSSVTAMCDANSTVKVYVYKAPNGHDFVVENMVGNWSKYSSYRYDLKVTKNSSFTVRYVR